MSPQHTSDVVIIGGGVIGLTIARALRCSGVQDVCLIEKAELGSEASFAAAGILAPQVEADSDNEFFRLACRSRDMYVDFAAALLEETDVDVELDTTGTLYVAFTESNELDCEERFLWQSRSHFEVEKLTSLQVRALEPCVSPSVRIALLFPRDIQVENRRLVSALANSVKRSGVRILTHTRSHEIRVDRNKIIGVETSSGFISCNTVVVSAGCWTGSLRLTNREGHPIGITTPKIEPVRGQMVCLEAKPQLTSHVIYGPKGYVVPRRDGRLLAGSTSEPGISVKQNTAGGVRAILDQALQITPEITRLPLIDVWSGLRPKAADGLPVLGPCGEIDGLHYATGHYRNGILLAPITGELIAQAILDPANATALAPFSPNRFRTVPAGIN
jgi:glycine oxidase